MKIVGLWGVTPCGSCENHSPGGKYRHHMVIRISELRTTLAELVRNFWNAFSALTSVLGTPIATVTVNL
jgi:hypothetical protein